jgi:hypothetical protein
MKSRSGDPVNRNFHRCRIGAPGRHGQDASPPEGSAPRNEQPSRLRWPNVLRCDSRPDVRALSPPPEGALPVAATDPHPDKGNARSMPHRSPRVALHRHLDWRFCPDAGKVEAKYCSAWAECAREGQAPISNPSARPVASITGRISPLSKRSSVPSGLHHNPPALPLAVSDVEHADLYVTGVSCWGPRRGAPIRRRRKWRKSSAASIRTRGLRRSGPSDCTDGRLTAQARQWRASPRSAACPLSDQVNGNVAASPEMALRIEKSRRAGEISVKRYSSTVRTRLTSSRKASRSFPPVSRDGD